MTYAQRKNKRKVIRYFNKFNRLLDSKKFQKIINSNCCKVKDFKHVFSTCAELFKKLDTIDILDLDEDSKELKNCTTISITTTIEFLLDLYDEFKK